MEVIARLNHIHTLAIKNYGHITYGRTMSTELTKGDSFVELILCNEDLSIDLSSHEKLQTISLDKCKHLSISTVDTTSLRSCRIRGLVYPHEHFKLLSSSFAQAEVLEDLTLEDISCHRSGCKEHHIDLSGNKSLRTFTLGDCDYLGVNISSSCELKSCGFHRYRLSHAQCKDLSISLTKLAYLKTLEIDSLHCDDVGCKGHSIDLSAHPHLDNLCLKNCIQIGVVGGTGSKVTSCTIRQCTFSHEQCSEVSSLLTQSISLRTLDLRRIECSQSTCDGHKADLFEHKHLQNVKFFDKCIYPSSLNTTSLETLDCNISQNVSNLPDGMLNARTLKEFKLEALPSNIVYTLAMNSLTQTFKRLQTLKLCNVNIAALSIPPDMEHLRFIELMKVELNQSIWCKFIDSLIKLKQCVNVRTSLMSVRYKETNTTGVAYVTRRSANFKVIPDLRWDFSFELKR